MKTSIRVMLQVVEIKLMDLEILPHLALNRSTLKGQRFGHWDISLTIKTRRTTESKDNNSIFFLMKDNEKEKS